MSLPALPADVLRHEIARRLDPTSKAQFRTVSKDLLALFPKAPRFSVSRWELAAQHTARDQHRRSVPKSVFPADCTGLVRRLDQAMHDDHGSCFDAYWTALLELVSRFSDASFKEDFWQHVLYVAISCGSLHAWTAVSNTMWSEHDVSTRGEKWKWPAYLPIDDRYANRIRWCDLLCYGIGFGQTAFLLKITPYTADALYKLALADDPPARDRYRARRSCIHMLLKGHHFADFQAIWALYQNQQRSQMGVLHRNEVDKACRNGALRHGLGVFVSHYAVAYTYGDLIEAIPNATSIDGLVALEQVRPDLFQKMQANGKRGKYAAAVAKRSGSIPVLQWLIFQKGYSTDTAATFTRLKNCASQKGHWRTAEWAQGQLDRLERL
jgi:hypothetical protein